MEDQAREFTNGGISLLSDLLSERTNAVESLEKEKTAKAVQDWIVTYLADLMEVDPEEVEVSIPFDSYGLDSSAAIGLTGDLEDWLGFEVDPTAVYDYPTIESLSKHLGDRR